VNGSVGGEGLGEPSPLKHAQTHRPQRHYQRGYSLPRQPLNASPYNSHLRNTDYLLKCNSSFLRSPFHLGTLLRLILSLSSRTGLKPRFSRYSPSDLTLVLSDSSQMAMQESVIQ